MFQKIVIIGAGGLALQVLDILDACNQLGLRYEILGYIVDHPYGKPGSIINGFPILGDFEWFDTCPEEIFAITAVAAPHVKLRLVNNAKDRGVHFCNAFHPRTILSQHLVIGEDVGLHASTILSNQNRIGNHVNLNMGCIIGENTCIADFATLSPGVHIAGDVTIGTGAYVGIGVNIIEKVRIGEWSVIGAGSTIIRDVPPNTTVVGGPGKVIKTREVGWHLPSRSPKFYTSQLNL